MNVPAKSPSILAIASVLACGMWSCATAGGQRSASTAVSEKPYDFSSYPNDVVVPGPCRHDVQPVPLGAANIHGAALSERLAPTMRCHVRKQDGARAAVEITFTRLRDAKYFRALGADEESCFSRLTLLAHVDVRSTDPRFAYSGEVMLTELAPGVGFSFDLKGRPSAMQALHTGEAAGITLFAGDLNERRIVARTEGPCELLRDGTH